jgi:hypothetical protein
MLIDNQDFNLHEVGHELILLTFRSRNSSETNKYVAACTAMSKIASTAATFWTDTPFGSNSGCKSALQPVQGLAQFFGALSPETLPRRG